MIYSEKKGKTHSPIIEYPHNMPLRHQIKWIPTVSRPQRGAIRVATKWRKTIPARVLPSTAYIHDQCIGTDVGRGGLSFAGSYCEMVIIDEKR